MPSRWESFSFSSCKNPIVMEHLLSHRIPSSLPEVVVDGATGYLFDLDNIQKALDLLNIKTKKIGIR